VFEQVFKNIDDVLWKEAGCTTELNYTEQTSWLLFLKYLDGLEQDLADEAALEGKKLLQGLAEKGFGGEQLAEMQKIIGAEKSDLFDVLAHVAYALPPLTREERAAKAKVLISTHFNSKQQVFLTFVLSHYVSVGVEELDQDKLTPLLRLKYHNSIADALADLGRAEDIGRVFAGFQKYLYQQQAAA
jgi:type I restriction enzyme R subunit